MKRPGSFSLLAIPVLAAVVVYYLLKGCYHLLVPSSNADLQLFHSNILNMAEYYTAVGGGSLGARFMLGLFFSVIVGFVLIALAMLIAKGMSSKRSKRAITKTAGYLSALLLLFSVVNALLVPRRTVEYNTAARQVEITDHSSLLFFLQNPMAADVRAIPFDSVQRFVFDMYDNNVRGASHIETDLFMITQSDTVHVGSAMLLHGEFGWITDWRSREEISADGREKAIKAVGTLQQLLQLD